MEKYNIRSKSRVIHKAIFKIFEEQEPKLTVRQIYYALTVKGVVPKTEGGYRQTCYQLGEMRKHEIIPYAWIADNTRWQIKPNTYPNLEDALDRLYYGYRRDLWVDQPVYVEIWVEKDALAGVISPITKEYDVGLYVCHGYSSTTYLFEAAEDLKRLQKPVYIYHFGDFDPSGVDAAYKVREGLIKHGADIHFKRAAVTPEQIASMKLPTRKTKRSDPRSKGWGDKPSVELDAIPAPILRKLVRDCIEKHINHGVLRLTRQIEEGEKGLLSKFIKNFVQEQNSNLDES